MLLQDVKTEENLTLSGDQLDVQNTTTGQVKTKRSLSQKAM